MKLNSLFPGGGRIVLPIVFLMFLNLKVESQLDSPFTYLNAAEFTSGIFYPKTFHVLEVPDGQELKLLTVDESRQVYLQLQHAYMNSSGMADLTAHSGQLRQISFADHSIPISIVDLIYHDVKTNAVPDGMIYLDNGFWYTNNDNTVSPFQEKSALLMNMETDVLTGNQVTFSIPSGCFISNRETPDLIEMDFDDGAGFVPVSFNQSYQVNYPEMISNKILKLRLTRYDEIQLAGIVLKTEDESDNPFPYPILSQAADIGLGDATNGWQLCTDVDGEEICANAYTLWSDDGILDKPFIFVEGIDFNISDHFETRNGDFGWYQFTSGLSESYDFLHDMPALLNELRAQNYDLILLDFYDGAYYIEKNAMVLVELIQLVNEHKTGNQSLVVAGASMGGQISRVALAYMESNDLKHCTRLWISLDSPHRGAYIPIGLQSMIDIQDDFNAGALMFRQDYLQRPAARQLLMEETQVFGPSLNTQYMNYLETLGYPKFLRKVAIANGNGQGVSLPIECGQSICDWECDAIFGTDGARLFMAAAPGSTTHPESNGLNRVLAEYRITEVNSFGIDNVLGQEPLLTVNTYVVSTNSENMTCYDRLPGGKRNSMDTFIEHANLTIQGSIDSGSDCSLIQNWQYEPSHCFIPTVSALGIETDNFYLDISNVLESNPELIPFDNIKTAPIGLNERHSEVTLGIEGNIPFTLSEVLNGEDKIQGILNGFSPNAGVFNYGAVGDFIIHDVTVNNGGVLKLNCFQFFHFGTIANTPQADVGKFMLANCEGNVRIEQEGELIVGDASGQFQSHLIIPDDAVLESAGGGIVKINPYSIVRVAPGGELRLSGGNVVLATGARIIVEEGAKLIITGNSQLISEGADTKVELFGSMEILENLQWSISDNGENRVVVSCLGTGSVITGSINSKLILIGNDTDSQLLEVNGKLTIAYPLGAIELTDGEVYLNGEIHSWTKLTAENTDFNGFGSLNIFSNNNLKNCGFHEISLIAFFSNHMLNVKTCTFQDGSNIFMNGGGFNVANSLFEGAAYGIESTGLTLNSYLSNSVFSGLDFCIKDDSNVDITIKGCMFNNSSLGVLKTGGKLNLRCNEFAGLNWFGVEAGPFCWLNMSADFGGGYNDFYNNKVNVQLTGASRFDLLNGHNTLADFQEMNIMGTINSRQCQQGGMSILFNASSNAWSYGNSVQVPDLEYIDISINDCLVHLFDNAPELNSVCGQFNQVSTIKPTKSLAVKDPALRATNMNIEFRDEELEDPDNPYLHTPDFDNVKFEDALSFAAGFGSAFEIDSNDVYSIYLFHQILCSPLDKTNPEIRWKMKWGQRCMKNALEALYSREVLFASMNQSGFTTDTQRYVDVLNAMTQNPVTDSTYVDQFYLEIDKAQLFRLVGNLDLGYELLFRADDCQLDSIEQAHLNNWLTKFQLDMELHEDLQDFQYDEDIAVTDSSAFQSPIDYTLDEYYFGTWIESYDQVSYIPCGPIGESSLMEKKFAIYPNPASNSFNIVCSSDAPSMNLVLYDMKGQKCQVWNNLICDLQVKNLKLATSLSSGIYMVEMNDGSLIENHLLVVE